MGIGIVSAIQAIKPTPKDLLSLGGRVALKTFVAPTGEPQRSYAWEVTLQNGSNTMDGSGMKYYAQSVAVPEARVDVVTTWYLGEPIYHPMRDASAHQLELTVWDDQNLTSSRFFRMWLNYLGMPNYGKSITRASYLYNAVLSLKDTTDLFDVMDITLADCFPISIGSTNLSYDGSNLYTFQVTLQYATMNFGTLKLPSTTSLVGGLINKIEQAII